MYRPLVNEYSAPPAIPATAVAGELDVTRLPQRSLALQSPPPPPQACRVIAQTALAMLSMLLGAAAFGVEMASIRTYVYNEDESDDDHVQVGPAIAGFILAFIICIAVAVVWQVIYVKRFGQNVLDLNTSLSCQVTMLTTALTFSIFIDAFLSFWEFVLNFNTTGLACGCLLAAMAVTNFISAIFGCCATCSSSCGGCCNCHACCVTKPFSYHAERPNQIGSGY